MKHYYVWQFLTKRITFEVGAFHRINFNSNIIAKKLYTKVYGVPTEENQLRSKASGFLMD